MAGDSYMTVNPCIIYGWLEENGFKERRRTGVG